VVVGRASEILDAHLGCDFRFRHLCALGSEWKAMVGPATRKSRIELARILVGESQCHPAFPRLRERVRQTSIVEL
jgi:hypothetical protein